ncbi:MAG: hypothetical protein DMD36_11565 [Gemmatimonadetes bacterium]|nr:MAG: hypothetical protein DMD36_11565 [Gemmatimonadota bacterium]
MRSGPMGPSVMVMESRPSRFTVTSHGSVAPTGSTTVVYQSPPAARARRARSSTSAADWPR